MIGKKLGKYVTAPMYIRTRSTMGVANVRAAWHKHAYCAPIFIMTPQVSERR